VEVSQEFDASPGLKNSPSFHVLPEFQRYSRLTPRLGYPDLPLLFRQTLRRKCTHYFPDVRLTSNTLKKFMIFYNLQS
jgi:hypothetical protein